MSSSPTSEASSDATFRDLALDDDILRALDGLGFHKPTPIQSEAIPHLMQGKDIIGGARTGSGKTAAFGLPLLHLLRDGGRTPRALILAPTRELARQVSKALQEFSVNLPLHVLTVYGGVGYRQQLRSLKQGVSVVVGTPGRVLDLVEKGALRLDKLEMLVLDEADEMLQMGFIEDIERVLDASPDGRQIALFSATMPSAIKKVAQRYLQDPVRVQVESNALTTSHISQTWLLANSRDKVNALVRVLKAADRDGALIFARTRKSCAELSARLLREGFSVDALHGDLNQGAREQVLAKLRAKQIRVVVATDVAARGLDVDHITHVINYDMPQNSEVYVHRIGRTARAGREGNAITFVASRERGKLRVFQRELKGKFERVYPPTDAEIARKQAGQLLSELNRAAGAIDLSHAENWIEAVQEEHEISKDQMLAAAISLLSKDRGISLAPVKADDRPPRRDRDDHDDRYDDRRGGRNERSDRDDRNDRGRRNDRDDRGDRGDREERGSRPKFSTINEVELFFPVGRRDGLRPADFIGALCNQAALPAEVIGRVTLGGKQSFVGMPRRVAMELLQKHPTLELRGTAYPLELSQSTRDGDAPAERQGHRGPKKSFNRGGGIKRTPAKSSKGPGGGKKGGKKKDSKRKKKK